MSQTDQGHHAPVLPRTMGLFALTMYGIGDMLGAGIYALIGSAAAKMGNAVWLAFAASMVAAMFTSLSYAALGSRYPKAAGAAYVTQRAFGIRLLAYTMGLMTMASGLMSFAAGANAFSEQVHKQFLAKPAAAVVSGTQAGGEAASGAAGVQAAAPLSPPPRADGWASRTYLWPIILGYIGVLTLINFWGMRESTWTNVLCTFVEVGGLVVVVAVGLSYWGSVNYLETPLMPGTTGGERVPLSLPLILSGGVLTFYAFIGFEDMLNVSEEVKDVERVFPKALILAITVTTVIYLMVAITAVSVLPHEELAKGGSLVDVVAKAAPWFPRWIFAAVSLFAIANTGLLNYIMGSRVVYGMSRQGLLPGFLGRLHHRRRTPHIAILALMSIVVVLALSGGISDLASATSLLLLVVFTVVNVALIVLKRRPEEPRGRFDVPVIVPAVGAVVCSGLVAMRLYEAVTTPTVAGKSPPWMAPLLALMMVGIIVGLYFLVRPKDVVSEE